MKKALKVILITAVAVVTVAMLLWYYQSQGIIKIFPTNEERRINALLKYDSSRFGKPEGEDDQKFQSAIKMLEDQKKAILSNPSSSQAWFELGHTLEYLNDHEDSAKVWEEALRLQPLNFVTAGNLGNVYQYFLKNYSKAEHFYLKALEVKPDYTNAIDGLVDLYQYNWKEKKDKLEPVLLTAIKNDQPNQTSYYITLTEFFASENDYVKAKAYLSFVKTLKPEAATELVSSYPELGK